MNFLAEVLSSVEKVELQEVNEKLPEFKIKIARTKSRTREFFEVVYLTYMERPRENRKVFAELKSMEKEINALKQNIESIKNKQLADATSDIDKHVSTLLSIDFMLSIVSTLGELNGKLALFDDMLKKNDYSSCMKLIFELEPLPNQLMEDEQLVFLDEIQKDIGFKKLTLLNKLSNVFSDNIVVKCVAENHTIMKIRKSTSALQNALQALYLNNSVISLLSSFVNSLWKYFIIPAVDNTIILNENEDEDFNVLEINIDSSKTKSMYPLVFSNVQTILRFLKVHLDFELAENISIMKLIGDDIRDNLAELIIKHCLEDTIPSASEDLPNYKTVIQETEQFEKMLQAYDIFAEDSTSLKEYANNIDINFINKKCKDYLSECYIIMKKDLHDMTEVGTPYSPNNALDLLGNELPHCCISKSAIELIKYLEKIILQATSVSEVCAAKLLYTVKRIIIEYGHLVPEYHSKLLQTIPQQVALFQNNCSYISFELTTWKEKFSLKLSPKLEIALCNFTEEAYKIKQKGIDCFTSYVCKTKDSLIIIGIVGPMLEAVSPDTEKSIRQCMRQQELLKTVWHKVLSYPLYNRTIGIILNSMCSNLIDSVVSIEDISSKAAQQLMEVFKIVMNRGPKLFTDPKEINLFVPSWYKFNELNFVLIATLLEILERWADGKGPLAMQFKATEMKSLIRALFQNTDRRASVLSRIHD